MKNISLIELARAELLKEKEEEAIRKMNQSQQIVTTNLTFNQFFLCIVFIHSLCFIFLGYFTLDLIFMAIIWIALKKGFGFKCG